ncbi:related to pheromone receptor [Cephalotrichum gorgonifer]|uniref:Related to pheromone receptor n=1 Tax=Cephalotrichum gorgonifer TaxID=2041049 RepID=A0AAE8MS98_9PEZI|nr:related to pheromone receptor [Cephalotrichum gorgonifer]
MEPFDPHHQVFNITAADGKTQVPISVDQVNFNYFYAFSICISYGSQIGASIMMLVVVVAMNPTVKILKAYTAAQTAALAANVVRMVILSLFFPSEWNEFYAFFSGDFSHVPLADYRMSVAGNVISLVVVVLVELCLVMQAWSMVRMWNHKWRWLATGISATISLSAIAFRFTFCVLQSEAIVNARVPGGPNGAMRWVPRTAISLGAASIFWFCALFNVQLVSHIVKNRRFLPGTAGLSPVEVLACANSVLMVVPVVFASLQWFPSLPIEAGSLTYTSVVVVLPLGTLVANRLTGGRSVDNSAASWNSKPSATHSNVTTSTNPNAQLVTHIGSSRGRVGSDPVDIELNWPEHGSVTSGGVRVHRELDQEVQRLI